MTSISSCSRVTVSKVRGSATYVWFTAEKLGTGSIGPVYRARHRRTGATCAVKICKRSSKPYYENEVKLRQMISGHPNIVKLLALETETITNKKVLIYELCTEGTLDSYLQHPRNAYGLGEKEFHCVLKDIFLALQYIHEQGIQHQNFRPKNILFAMTSDGRKKAMLTDFSHAKKGQAETKPKIKDMTHVEDLCCTNDILGYCMTMYLAATGRWPLETASRRSSISQLITCIKNKNGEVLSLRELEDGTIEERTTLPSSYRLSTELKNLLRQMLRDVFHAPHIISSTTFFKKYAPFLKLEPNYVFYFEECRQEVIYNIRQQTWYNENNLMIFGDRVRSGNGSVFPTRTTPTTPVIFLRVSSSEAGRPPTFPDPGLLPKKPLEVLADVHQQSRHVEQLTKTNTFLDKTKMTLGPHISRLIQRYQDNLAMTEKAKARATLQSLRFCHKVSQNPLRAEPAEYEAEVASLQLEYRDLQDVDTSLKEVLQKCGRCTLDSCSSSRCKDVCVQSISSMEHDLQYLLRAAHDDNDNGYKDAVCLGFERERKVVHEQLYEYCIPATACHIADMRKDVREIVENLTEVIAYTKRANLCRQRYEDLVERICKNVH